jgi:hypothetical protein
VKLVKAVVVRNAHPAPDRGLDLTQRHSKDEVSSGLPSTAGSGWH